jgi:hypothetical protein
METEEGREKVALATRRVMQEHANVLKILADR